MMYVVQWWCSRVHQLAMEMYVRVYVLQVQWSAPVELHTEVSVELP